ncbi:hypothetical protein [Streptomyces sp. NBC_01483]|uniref:hypothetical protein n=1 Tax=Streptomyces sp. NBC_01483 TaxID=2903883 RepID=UPI002E35C436|nr:hypothetical protein [Streptomyces sp. NBC_01483]
MVPLFAVTSSTLAMCVEWMWGRPGWKKGMVTAPSTVDRRITGMIVVARTEHGMQPERTRCGNRRATGRAGCPSRVSGWPVSGP